MKINKTTLILVILLLLTIIISWIIIQKKQQQIQNTQLELRKEIIRKDALQELSDGYYRRIISDTLSEKQIEKLSKEIIKLKNRKPKVITKIVSEIKEVEKTTDSISKNKDSINIIDYYPNKNNPFIKYTNKFSLDSLKGVSKFSFPNKLTITGVILEREDGIFELDLKTPEFIEVKNIDIQALPMIPKKQDNWGHLVGLNYGKLFFQRAVDVNENASTDLEINGIRNEWSFVEGSYYLRYKKFYIGVEVNTLQSYSTGIKVEF